MSNNRSFGILFFLVFIIIGLWPLKNNEEPVLILIAISAIFLILGITKSKFLTPLNIAWMKFGKFLGKIIAPVLMGVVYFLLITPISIILRIAGKDLMNLKNKNNVKSYWIERKTKLQSMKKQF